MIKQIRNNFNILIIKRSTNQIFKVSLSTNKKVLSIDSSIPFNLLNRINSTRFDCILLGRRENIGKLIDMIWKESVMK